MNTFFKVQLTVDSGSRSKMNKIKPLPPKNTQKELKKARRWQSIKFIRN